MRGIVRVIARKRSDDALSERHVARPRECACGARRAVVIKFCSHDRGRADFVQSVRLRRDVHRPSKLNATTTTYEKTECFTSSKSKNNSSLGTTSLLRATQSRALNEQQQCESHNALSSVVSRSRWLANRKEIQRGDAHDAAAKPQNAKRKKFFFFPFFSRVA